MQSRRPRFAIHKDDDYDVRWNLAEVVKEDATILFIVRHNHTIITHYHWSKFNIASAESP